MGKNGQRANRGANFWIFFERERLLSKFLGDSTVGIRRDKKESCSTGRGLRVDSGFEEFCQTPVLSYLGFTLYLSVL